MKNRNGLKMTGLQRTTHTRIYDAHREDYDPHHPGCLDCYRGEGDDRMKVYIHPDTVPELMAVLALLEPSWHSSSEWNHYFITNEEFDALVPNARWEKG